MRILRVLAAALLVGEAGLLAHPVLVLNNLFVGAGVLGKSLAFVQVPDVIGQGVAYLVTPTVAVLLLLAAWGVAHTTRGIGALVLQPLVLAGAVIPFLRPMLLVEPTVLLLLVVATVGLLLVVIGSGQTPAHHRRWWVLAAYAVLVGALATTSATSRTLPTSPLERFVDSGTGSASVAENLPRARPPQNPSLARNPFNGIHNDAWATDTYNLPAPGPDGTVDSLSTGGDCATMTFDSRGRLVTLCSTLTRVVAYVVDPRTLDVLDSRIVGTRSASLTDFTGGGYFVLDDQDRIVFPERGGVLRVLSTGAGLPEVASVNVASTLVAGEQVTSVLPDWQGRYWYVGAKGTVGVVRQGQATALNLGGEDIENSFAVDADGVYVVTGAALYRLSAGTDGPPRQVWRTEYDAGTAQKPGQTSAASGTTPTLFSDWGVAITDNADPQMHVVVADRRTGRLVCEVPVFGAGASATENSLIAVDDTLLAENNYGYAPAVSSTMAGRSTTPGMAAVSAVDGDCAMRWSTEAVHVPSLVSKASTRGGQVLTYTKPPDSSGVDAWYFTSVDARTGAVNWTRLAGIGSPFNNHYAGAFLYDGDLFVGTLNGITVLRGAP